VSWFLSVFRGDPDDLSHEKRLAPLDLERARRLIHAEGDVDDFGRQIVIGREATFTDIAVILDGEGVLRAIESEIHWDIAPAAALRDELRKLLDLFFRLGDELDAWVFDHEAWSFVTRADTDDLLASRAPEREPSR
jgi:hypothetical protein